MGVMACSRRGCSTILCSATLFYEHYICEDCLEELISLWEICPCSLDEEVVKKFAEQFLDGEPIEQTGQRDVEEFKRLLCINSN